MRTFTGQWRGRRRRGQRQIASMVVGAALVCAVFSAATAAAQTTSGLKPIDQRALRALVGKTAQELHVPGAVVLLRTPQGEFTAT
jgi:D-alanyl-D-alanine carboxypeptidase